MKKAFTLIELLLALTMLTILIMSVTPALGTVWRSWRRLAAANDRRQIENIVMTRLVNDLREGSQINSGSTTGEVIFTVKGETISYALVNSKVRRKTGSAAAYLTNENEIKSLSFQYSAGKIVGIKLDDLATTVALRN
jgi:prepilin-type N-terminal cleavage/methylation domain-containing protein